MNTRTKKQRDALICDLYQRGQTSEKIAGQVGLTKRSVLNALIREGIARRPSNAKRYNINEYAFSAIKNQETAYWLGFIYADGSVAHPSFTRNRFNLSSSTRDERHLQKFLEFLDCDKPLRYRKNYCFVDITNKRFVDDLMRHGVLPRKSLSDILRFPFYIDTQLYSHFMRGYFDGDGSISTFWRKDLKMNADGYFSSSFFVCGSPTFIKSYQQVLIEQTKVLPTKRYRKGKIDLAGHTGIGNLKKIYSFLYNESSVCLERKHLLFRDIVLGRYL